MKQNILAALIAIGSVSGLAYFINYSSREIVNYKAESLEKKTLSAKSQLTNAIFNKNDKFLENKKIDSLTINNKNLIKEKGFLYKNQTLSTELDFGEIQELIKAIKETFNV